MQLLFCLMFSLHWYFSVFRKEKKYEGWRKKRKRASWMLCIYFMQGKTTGCFSFIIFLQFYIKKFEWDLKPPDVFFHYLWASAISNIYTVLPVEILLAKHLLCFPHEVHYARGGQIILPWDHFQKAAFSGEDTFLWKQKQVSVKLGSAVTFTMVRWRIFQIWKFSWNLPRATENAVSGHIWPVGPLFAHPCTMQ